jgi:pyruvate dehydrogenase (quinone)
VQIDIDGKRLGFRYPTEVNVTGDSGATLRALLPLLRRKEDRSWRAKIERSTADWWKTVEQRAMAPADRSTASASSGSCPRACPPTR